MSLVDLQKVAIKATDKEVYNTTVAVFKDSPEKPRVLADSHQFIAYTLKNGRTVRVISRSNNMKGSLKAHGKDVHAVRFVNYRSNVAASAADGEFFVWVVTDTSTPDVNPATSTLSVRLYFRLKDPVTIWNFSFFINAKTGMPDALVLYEKKAAVLASSKLIAKYDKDVLEATLSADTIELRGLGQPANASTLCCINSGGWLAFTSEPALVVACTMRNSGTPAWAACEGGEVKGLQLLDSMPDDAALLITSSNDRVFQWKLSGDTQPELLRVYSFGGTIVTLLSSRSLFAVFNDSQQLALIDCTTPGSYKASAYNLPFTVRRSSVCFSRAAAYGCVLVDTQSTIEMLQLTLPESTASSPVMEAPAQAAKPSEAGAQAASTLRLHEDAEARRAASPHLIDPAILAVTSAGGTPPIVQQASRSSASPPGSAISNLLVRLQASSNASVGEKTAPSATAPPPVVPKPPTSSPSTIPSALSAKSTASAAPVITPVGPSPASQAARAVLFNSALPQPHDGLFAAATSQAEDDVRREVENLQNVMKNVVQIINLTPDQIARDHEQLVNLALEAQMTELQNALSKQRGGANANGKGDASNRHQDDGFVSYAVASALGPIAKDIATGVTNGIRGTLDTELDHAIRGALAESARKIVKNITKRKMDDLLEDSTDNFITELNKYIENKYVKDVGNMMMKWTVALDKLAADNERLRQALGDIMKMDFPGQLNSLRTQLTELQSTVCVGGAGGAARSEAGANPSNFPGAHATPQTVLTTALELVQGGNVARGLTYILLARQPSLTLQLMRRLKDNAYSTLVSDTRVGDDLWLKVLTQLCTEGVTEGTEDVECVVEIIFDVLSERESLTSKTAVAQKLMSDIRRFVSRSRGNVLTTDGRRALLDLEKSML